MIQKIIQNKYQILLFFGSLIVFSVGLGSVHLFDWDEINFAESAREMLLTGDYLNVQINFEIFWEKPPFFIWLQALSMSVFGINEFAARFPNALAGAVTLVTLFNIGKALKNRLFGALWVISYVGSLLPFLYFKSGIIDPWFNLFIFLGLYFFIKYQQTDSNIKNIIFSGFFIGMSMLTKGPVGLLIFLLSIGVFFALNHSNFKLKIRDILMFSSVFIFIGGFWFILQIINGNSQIIQDFIIYQIRLFKTKDAGHGGFLFYHFIILFFGVFPASVFALRSFIQFKETDEKTVIFTKWMKILFWVVLILFTIVKTKIVHYSSLCYFPITYLATDVIYKLYHRKIGFSKIYVYIIGSIGTFLGIIVLLLPTLEIFKKKIIASGLIKDAFATGNLQANVHWSPAVYAIGLFMIFGSLMSIKLIKQKDSKHRYTGIFFTTALFTYSALFFVVPKVEKYSQNAAIEFYQSHAGEDAYIETLGFKSYAHLYYFRKKANMHVDKNEEWFGKGNIDKPVYFVCKNFRKKDYQKRYPELKELYEKNGFVFFKRLPKKFRANDK